MVLHDHSGCTTLRNWDVVNAEVSKAIVSSKPAVNSDTLTEQLCGRAEMLSARLVSTFSQLPQDIEGCYNQVGLKSAIKKSVDLMGRCDVQLTGAEVHELLQGVTSNSLHSSA